MSDAPNYESMSDEEFLNLPLEEIHQEDEIDVNAENDAEPEGDVVDDEENIHEDAASEDTEEDEGTDEESDDELESEESEDEDTELNDEESDTDPDDEDDISEDAPEKDKDLKEDNGNDVGDIDYKSEYERILAPFRANGKEMKLDSADDVIKLMQMGAGFNKKMAEFKPYRKTMKMLQNNDLLDEGKLSFLIDLHKKDPAAITKLIKDSEINPLDLDLETATEYKPNTHTVDDKEIDFEDAVSDIKDTDTYDRTIQIVGTEWDDSSRQALFREPAILNVINGHIASGIYDKIATQMEKDKMLGNLTGLSDLEAYMKVGKQLNDQGAFAPKPAPVAKRKPAPKAPDPKVTNRKRKLAPTKSNKSKTAPDIDSYASMSDEKFMELMDESLL